MKLNRNTFLAAAVLATVALSSLAAPAAVYYWDNNGPTAGFGDAGGTWETPTAGLWSTSNAGTASPGTITTTLADDLFFGFTSTGLGPGTITVDGTVNARMMIFAAANGAVTLDGGTINLAPIHAALNLPAGNANTGTILVTSPAGATINSSISGAQSGFVKSVTGNVDTVTGGPLTLGGANTFSGPTINRAGVLELGHSLALQDSPLRSNSSQSGTANAGLRTTVTSLTLGGLEGAKDLDSLFSTAIGGYDDVASLTLNPGANRIEFYSGEISDGAPGMNLVKTGAGVQAFAGSHHYTGTTTISGGTLWTAAPTALPGYDSSGKIVIQGGTLAVAVGGSGWTTGQVGTLLTNATKTNGALGIDTSAGDLTQWTPFTPANLGGLGLHKLGPNTLTLNQPNSHTGATILSGGTLRLQNPSAGFTQTLGALAFGGGDATLESDYNGGTGILSTSFGPLIDATFGGTLNVVAKGGVNGTSNRITTTGNAGFIGADVFFGGTDYAARSAADGFFRALAYGTDPDTEAVNTMAANMHVKFTESPEPSPGETLLSLNLSGEAVDYTISSGTLVTPGILKSGGGDSLITGGAISGGGQDLVIRTDLASDELEIQSQVTGSGALVKSGAGTLLLRAASSNHTGDTFVNGGTLSIDRTTTYAGNIHLAQGASLRHQSGNLTLNGLIHGGGTLVKNGGGTLTLNGVNSFTGGTIINGGTIAIQKIYDDAFGTGGGITFNADAVLLFSSAPTQSSFITFHRGFTLNNAAVARFNYSGNATITGPVTGTGGLWSSNSNNTQNTLRLLSTANTFTGPIILNATNIQPNTFETNSLADSTSPTLIRFASTTNPCRFRWGAGAIAPLILNNRQFDLSLTTGGSFIENANADPANTLTINSDLIVSGASNKTLTFTGINTGHNTFAGTIADGSVNETTVVISVAKTEAGHWTLAGNNTYSGLTTISGGTLTLAGNNSGATGGVTVNSTGRLSLTNPHSLPTGTLTFGGTAGPSIDNTSGAPLTLASNNPQSWLGEFTFVGSDDLHLGTGPVTLGGTRLVTVQNGTLTVGGAIGAASAAPGIQKLGPGTMVFAAENTYQGNTTINGGTLTLGVSDCLADASNVVLGNGTLNLPAGVSDKVNTLNVTNANATLHLGAGATLAFADSSALSWSGALKLTGTFVSGSLRFGTDPSGLTNTQLGLISATGFTDFTLDSQGYLTATAVGENPYSAWASGAAFHEDANGDGISNGLAFLLGAANPAANATALLPKVTETAAGLVMSFRMLNATARGSANLVVEHSGDLGIADTWTAVPAPAPPGVTLNGVTFTITTDGDFNNVVATIHSSQAIDHKLFGRLRAVEAP